MSSNNSLNNYGNVTPAIVTALMINSVHPFVTWQARLATGKSVFPMECRTVFERLRFSYGGISAIIASDIVQLGMMFWLNERLRERQIELFTAATISSAVSSLPIAIGEQIALYRQVHGSSYREAFRQSFRASAIHGLAATMIREIPYGIGMLAMPTSIAPWLPIENDPSRDAAAGFIAGLILGGISTPLNMAKTRIQAEGMTFRQGYACTWRDFSTQNQDLGRLVKITGLRVIHVALVMAIANVVKGEFSKVSSESTREA